MIDFVTQQMVIISFIKSSLNYVYFINKIEILRVCLFVFVSLLFNTYRNLN
jgi:hypothetical protein